MGVAGGGDAGRDLGRVAGAIAPAWAPDVRDVSEFAAHPDPGGKLAAIRQLQARHRTVVSSLFVITNGLRLRRFNPGRGGQ